MSNNTGSTNGHPAPVEKGITAIWTQGFKSLVNEQRVAIRPLTILAGANSSGKSSIMQPLLLLKQTLEATYDPGPLLLNGPNVRFTSAGQFLSKLDGRGVTDLFHVGLEVKGIIDLQNTFRYQPLEGIELIESLYQIGGNLAALRPGMTQKELRTLLEIENTWHQGRVFASEGTRFGIKRERCFLRLTLHISKGTETYFPASMLGAEGQRFSEPIQRLVHVPGLRGNPERTYKTTATGSMFPGTFENYLASVIHKWQTTNDKRLASLADTLYQLGLTWGVDARRIDDTQVEIRVGRLPPRGQPSNNDMVNISDVGFGVSQVLPVVVAVLVAEPDQLVYLEQPEIHLHPRAQVALAKVLADAANRGVRVVAETHSSLLLLGVQTLVAEGYISPDNVILHWFSRGDDGITNITTAELDEAGAFGDWPEDFGNVELEAESRYLDAAERQLMP